MPINPVSAPIWRCKTWLRIKTVLREVLSDPLSFQQLYRMFLQSIGRWYLCWFWPRDDRAESAAWWNHWVVGSDSSGIQIADSVFLVFYFVKPNSTIPPLTTELGITNNIVTLSERFQTVADNDIVTFSERFPTEANAFIWFIRHQADDKSSCLLLSILQLTMKKRRRQCRLLNNWWNRWNSLS